MLHSVFFSYGFVSPLSNMLSPYFLLSATQQLFHYTPLHPLHLDRGGTLHPFPVPYASILIGFDSSDVSLRPFPRRLPLELTFHILIDLFHLYVREHAYAKALLLLALHPGVARCIYRMYIASPPSNRIVMYQRLSRTLLLLFSIYDDYFLDTAVDTLYPCFRIYPNPSHLDEPAFHPYNLPHRTMVYSDLEHVITAISPLDRLFTPVKLVPSPALNLDMAFLSTTSPKTFHKLTDIMYPVLWMMVHTLDMDVCTDYRQFRSSTTWDGFLKLMRVAFGPTVTIVLTCMEEQVAHTLVKRAFAVCKDTIPLVS